MDKNSHPTTQAENSV